MHGCYRRWKTHGRCYPRTHFSLPSSTGSRSIHLPSLAPASRLSFTRQQMLPMRPIFLKKKGSKMKPFSTKLTTTNFSSCNYCLTNSYTLFVNGEDPFFKIGKRMIKKYTKGRKKGKCLKVAGYVVAGETINSHKL